MQKHVLARYMEHQNCFYLYFKKELLKKYRTLPVIDQDAVILANLNIDDSDSKSYASSTNVGVEESQCVEEKDYMESTNTEEQNSQNEKDNKIAEVTSNGRLKGFFVSENVENLSSRTLRKAEVSLLSKSLKFCPSSVDKSVLKEDLAKFGRTLRIRTKSKFNPSKN